MRSRFLTATLNVINSLVYNSLILFDCSYENKLSTSNNLVPYIPPHVYNQHPSYLSPYLSFISTSE